MTDPGSSRLSGHSGPFDTGSSHFDELFGNAASARHAAREDRALRRYLDDLRELARLPAGQRVLCEWLTRLGAFRSSWRQNAAIHYATAQKDFAEAILNDLALADEEAHDAIARSLRALAAIPNLWPDERHSERREDSR